MGLGGGGGIGTFTLLNTRGGFPATIMSCLILKLNCLAAHLGHIGTK